MRPVKPAGLKAPGLRWNPSRGHWVAYWAARPDLVKRGYTLKTQRLWPSSEVRGPIELTIDDWTEISASCRLLQSQMLTWANGGDLDDPLSIYDGTFKSLIDVYERDPDSPYQNLRYGTKVARDSDLSILKREIGTRAIKALTFRDFKRWHEAFRQPAERGGKERVARAATLMGLARQLIALGAALELPGCERVHQIIASPKAGGTGVLKIQGGRRRTVSLIRAQVIAIRAEAHHRGLHSMALAQAMTFDLGCRRGDVIGQWVPESEPGLSDVLVRGRKWVFGLRCNDVFPHLILTMRVSKSVRGRHASGQTNTGKFEQFNLKSFPMVMEELAFLGGRTTGPLVICELTGIPWRPDLFVKKWREIATAVGVPPEIQSRDARSGAITEGRKMGATLEDMRVVAGHEQISTTAGYDRIDMETRDKVARLRNGIVKEKN